ncbi:hypothetical protein Y919_01680 [Caloranaerobacter azorensis H53214]|uniref:Lantibiotic dehydratase N-terminal domain-containing protein n=2 Tax=Caloranaerobacter azorensis TaxID=116090 RepID=A0A096DPR5_9FIRM|nr:lantibiotic dehydratase [Caloranaerobacter azorensis]KGG81241.1 hypothetical protein Y919_01680 [Caloranaerobacter azorensis H53214]
MEKKDFLFPYFLERRNNVPKKELKKLIDEELINCVLLVMEYKKELEKISSEACDALEKIFKDTKNPRLLNCKRKIYNFKTIKQKEIAELDELSIRYVSVYCKTYEEVQRAKMKLNQKIIEAMENNRLKLQDFFKMDEIIKLAFPLINSDFDKKFNKYVSVECSKHKSKVRKLDHQLVRILSRAAVKTSPFSTFTSVALGRFKEDEESYINDENIEILKNVELNNCIIRAIFDSLILKESFLKQLEFKISMYKEYEDVYYFLVQKDTGKSKIYNSIDTNIRIKKNRVIGSILNRFKDSIFTYLDIKEYLEDFISKENVDNFIINILIKNKVIIPTMTLSEFGEDIFEEFEQKVSRLNDDDEKTIETVVKKLRRVNVLLDQFKTAKYKERFSIYNEIKQQIIDLSEILNISMNLDILIYEETYYKDYVPIIKIDREYREFIDSIREIQKFIKIFDQTYPILIPFSEQFKAKYWNKKVSCLDLDVYHLYSKIGFQYRGVWEDSLFDIKDMMRDDIKKVFELKKKFKEHILKLKDSKLPEVQITDIVNNIINEIPDSIEKISDITSSTIFYQKDKENYVINKIYNGNQVFFSRFSKLFSEIYEEEDFKEYKEYVFDKDKCVEVLEGFGFNANSHYFFNEHRLILPFSEEERYMDNAVYLKDCYFMYDEDRQVVRIYHKDKGELDVFFLGSLIYVLLPTVLRMILGLNPTSRFDEYYMNLWQPNAEDDKIIADNIPRIKYKNIVLFRRKWLIRNIFDMNRDLVEIYYDVISTFVNNNLPLEFFVRKYRGNKNIDYSKLGRTELKPKYIHLASPLLFREFIVELESDGFVILEEVLPNNSNEKFVREYQIEYTTRRGE